MEVERSLFRETSSGNPLQHLTVEDHQHAVLFPKRYWSLMRVNPDNHDIDCGAAATVIKFDTSQLLCSVIPDKSSVSEGVTAGAGVRKELEKEAVATSSSILAPEPLPIQIIERNRLSVAEIRALPRFRDYSPGVPNKVSGNKGVMTSPPHPLP